MLSTCIKHWMFDVGISKLFDNITANLKIGGDFSEISNSDKEKIQKALLEALNGYPYSTVNENDYDLFITLIKMHLSNKNIEFTSMCESYVISLLQSIAIPK